MIGKICLYFLYLNTVVSTENYILVAANRTEHEIFFFTARKHKFITCNNYLVTVVDLNYFDQTMNLIWEEEICNIDIDNNFKSGSRK